MRILVCGSRHHADKALIGEVLSHLPSDTVIIHGMAAGADKLAHQVATDLGMRIEDFPANWKRHGRAAGPIRNIAMLESGIDAVYAFPLKDSKGTWHTIWEAEKRGIKIRVFELTSRQAGCQERGI